MNWLERKIIAHLMIPHLRKFWLTYGTLIAGAFVYILPGLQAIAAAHPKTTIAFIIGLVIAAFHSTAPKDQA